MLTLPLKRDYLSIKDGGRQCRPTARRDCRRTTKGGLHLARHTVGLEVTQTTRGCALRVKIKKELTNHIQGGETWLPGSLSLSLARQRLRCRPSRASRRTNPKSALSPSI